MASICFDAERVHRRQKEGRIENGTAAACDPPSSNSKPLRSTFYRPFQMNWYWENAMSLLDRYSMDEEERTLGKAFLGITESDAQNLRSLRQAFQEFSQEFAERFYQHLLSHPRTASLLQDPQQLEALKKIQANYFAELLESTLD